MSDGLPLYSAEHPRNVSLWERIKFFFIRPRLSKEAIAPVTTKKYSLYLRGTEEQRRKVLDEICCDLREKYPGCVFRVMYESQDTA